MKWGGVRRESFISRKAEFFFFYFHHVIKNRFDFQILAQGSGTVPGECFSLGCGMFSFVAVNLTDIESVCISNAL
jgi:hypothetical protein